jgi:hypothetical protein
VLIAVAQFHDDTSWRWRAMRSPGSLRPRGYFISRLVIRGAALLGRAFRGGLFRLARGFVFVL